MSPLELRRAKAHLLGSDATMAEIVKRVGPCRVTIHRNGTTFAYLVNAILRQQISGYAAAAIERKIAARFGPALTPALVLAASDDELRSVGLSRQKVGYLRDLAQKATEGLPLERVGRFTDERIIATLTTVKGIGRWTCEMLLMFRLGRPDVISCGDYGIRKAMQTAYRMRALPKPKRMQKIAEAWRPHRTAACWYLWRSLEE